MLICMQYGCGSRLQTSHQLALRWDSASWTLAFLHCCFCFCYWILFPRWGLARWPWLASSLQWASYLYLLSARFSGVHHHKLSLNFVTITRVFYPLLIVNWVWSPYFSWPCILSNLCGERVSVIHLCLLGTAPPPQVANYSMSEHVLPV